MPSSDKLWNYWSNKILNINATSNGLAPDWLFLSFSKTLMRPCRNASQSIRAYNPTNGSIIIRCAHWYYFISTPGLLVKYQAEMTEYPRRYRFVVVDLRDVSWCADSWLSVRLAKPLWPNYCRCLQFEALSRCDCLNFIKLGRSKARIDPLTIYD